MRSRYLPQIVTPKNLIDWLKLEAKCTQHWTMTRSQSHAYFTPEEYLEIERSSPIKHHYLQGEMFAMAGASKAHVIITEFNARSRILGF